MAGMYTPISYDEMASVMGEYGYSLIVLPGTRELVYSKVVGKLLCCRVYTSIVKDESREVGEDAIRVCLVTRKNDGAIVGVGSSSRVYRLATWRLNLIKRLEGWSKLLGPECPYCGSLTAERKGKYGLFWGCVRYPECKGVIEHSKGIKV
jgi:hypothetical protein